MGDFAERPGLALPQWNNFKNARTSLGSQIVAIGNLAEDFERLEALVWRLGKPVLPVVGLTGQLGDFRYAAIQLVFVRQIHPPLLQVDSAGLAGSQFLPMRGRVADAPGKPRRARPPINHLTV